MMAEISEFYENLRRWHISATSGSNNYGGHRGSAAAWWHTVCPRQDMPAELVRWGALECQGPMTACEAMESLAKCYEITAVYRGEPLAGFLLPR